MKRLLLAFGFWAFAGIALAQPGSGPPPDPGEPLPISGIEVLLVGGALLGAGRKLVLRKLRKDQQDA